MRRKTRTISRRNLATRFENLEMRQMLTCNVFAQDDGTLNVIGDDLTQLAQIEDLGRGELSVVCYDRGEDPTTPQLHSGVSALNVELGGGHDILRIESIQDANDALKTIDAFMGSGSDVVEVNYTQEGIVEDPLRFDIRIFGEEGNDRLAAEISSRTPSRTSDQPIVHVELHGDAGRDTTIFSTTTRTGGVSLTTEELDTSSGANPDCQIWDLINYSTGEVKAQVMGSEVDEVFELVTETTGLGRKSFDILIDGRGGADTIDATVMSDTSIEGDVRVEMENADSKNLQVRAPDLDFTALANSDSASTSDPDCLIWDLTGPDPITGGSAMSLAIDGTEQRDAVKISLGENNLRSVDIQVDTQGGDDTIHAEITPNSAWDDGHWQLHFNGGTGMNTIDAILSSDASIGGDVNLEMTAAGRKNLQVRVPNLKITISMADIEPNSDPSCLIWDFAGTEVDTGGSAMSLDIDGSDRADDVQLSIGESELDRLSINVDTKGGDDKIRTTATANANWDTSFVLLDVSGGVGVDQVETSISLPSDSAVEWEIVASRAESVEFDYTKFSPDGVPVRSATAMLTSHMEGQTLMNGKGNTALTEEIEMVIERLERGIVSTLGFASAGVLFTNDELSFDVFAQQQQPTNGDSSVDVSWNEGPSFQQPEVDISLTEHDNATVDINAIDGSVLAIADIQLQTQDVSNLMLQIAAEDNSQRPITVAKTADPARQTTGTSRFRFGLASWSTFVKLTEEDLARVEFRADLPDHQIDIVRENNIPSTIEMSYTPDEIEFEARGSSGASNTAVSIVGQNPNDARLDLSLQTELPPDAKLIPGVVRVRVSSYSVNAAVDIELDSLPIDSARLRASGFSGMTRRLSDISIGGSYGERIDMNSRIGAQRKPLLIIAEDVEIGPGAQIRSHARSGGEVIRLTDGLILGDASTNVETTRNNRPSRLGNYKPQFYFSTIDVGAGASFTNRVLGSANDDHVIAEWDNITLRGGTFEFLAKLGDGADQFDLIAGNINVDEQGNFATRVDGEDGRDVIRADVQAIVNGGFAFLLRGGNGPDQIRTTQELTTTHLPTTNSAPPEISLIVEGGNGNDVLEIWLLPHGIDDEWITAIIDGGRGMDVCLGNVVAVNCER